MKTFLIILIVFNYINWVTAGKHREAFTRRCSVKKVFLKSSQNSQENTCVRIVRISFLIKLQAGVANFNEKRLQHRCFPVNIVKFLRTLFLIEHLLWLLLYVLGSFDIFIPRLCLLVDNFPKLGLTKRERGRG